MFGDGDAAVSDIGSRWGFKGSHEVAEGLTASYKYESKFNTTNAESSGGAGHGHDAADAIAGMTTHNFDPTPEADTFDDADGDSVTVTPVVYDPSQHTLDSEDGNVVLTVMNDITYQQFSF